MDKKKVWPDTPPEKYYGLTMREEELPEPSEAYKALRKKYGQTKRDSFIEANANTFIGLLGSLLITGLCNWFLIPLVGVWWTTAISVGLCTVWSIFRSYHVRRYFESRRRV